MNDITFYGLGGRTTFHGVAVTRVDMKCVFRGWLQILPEICGSLLTYWLVYHRLEN